ncbi:hypothetical protein ACJJTC_008626 [Scirpophaga incertulas]
MPWSALLALRAPRHSSRELGTRRYVLRNAAAIVASKARALQVCRKPPKATTRGMRFKFKTLSLAAPHLDTSISECEGENTRDHATEECFAVETVLLRCNASPTIETDHYLVVSRFVGLFKTWRHWRVRTTFGDLERIKTEKLNDESIRSKYVGLVSERLANVNLADLDVDDCWNVLEERMVDSAKNVCGCV